MEMIMLNLNEEELLRLETILMDMDKED